MAEDSFKAALIGPAFYGKLKETIAKVDGRPIGSGATKIPTDLGGDTSYAPKTFRIATFTGAWSVNSDKTVTLVSDTAQTLTATNLFYDLPNSGDSTCAIAKDGTAWYLVQDVHTSVTVITGVSLGSAGLQFTRAVVTVVATATASATNIGTTACT